MLNPRACLRTGDGSSNNAACRGGGISLASRFVYLRFAMLWSYGPLALSFAHIIIACLPCMAVLRVGGLGWGVMYGHSNTSLRGGGGRVGTKPWWLALLACGGAYWPLALEPSADDKQASALLRASTCPGGIQNATFAHGVLP